MRRRPVAGALLGDRQVDQIGGDAVLVLDRALDLDGATELGGCRAIVAALEQRRGAVVRLDRLQPLGRLRCGRLRCAARDQKQK
jgi:hypothetical protein